MAKFTFHMGVNARCYGDVIVDAASIEKAVAMLTADYVGDNIDVTEKTWDGLTGLSIIEVRDEVGTELDDYVGTDLPSDYDPPAPVAAIPADILAALKAGRDELNDALYTHVYDVQHGETPDPDDSYVKTIALMDAAIANAEAAPIAAPAESANTATPKSDADYLAQFPVEARPFADRAYQDGYVDGVEQERSAGGGGLGNLFIVVEGGLVKEVLADGALVGLPFKLIDYDVDGSDEADLTPIPQDGGGTELAYVEELEIARGFVATEQPAESASAKLEAQMNEEECKEALMEAGWSIANSGPNWGDFIRASDGRVERLPSWAALSVKLLAEF